MSAGTLTVHQIFDVLTDLDAFARGEVTDTSTIYVNGLGSPAIRIVFANDPVAPGLATSFTIEDSTGAVLYAAGDYAVSLDAFDAALIAGTGAALGVLFEGLGTLALAPDADVDLASVKSGLAIEGNDLGTAFTVTHSGVTLNAGAGDDSISVKVDFGDGRFDGGEGYDTIWIVDPVMAVDILAAQHEIVVANFFTAERYARQFEGIEFIRGSAGMDNFHATGNGMRFEGGAENDNFMFEGSEPLSDIVDYGGENGGKGIVVNLGFDPYAPPGLTGELAEALALVLGGDMAPPLWLVRDSFGSYDYVSTGFIIEGTTLADFFYGSGEADAFVGDGGDDHFFGGDGSDRIDGGDGDDTFYLSGARGAYDVVFDDDAFTITATDGSGSDVIENVERFVFGTEGFTAAELAPVVAHAPVAMDDDNGVDSVIEAAVGVTGDSSAQGDVLANDDDADDDALTVAGIRAGAIGDFVAVSAGTELAGQYGTLTIGTDGKWTYLLDDGRAATDALQAGVFAHDVFTYRISDGTDTSEATLDVAIAGSNDAPLANDDTGLTTDEDTALVIGAAVLLGNDSDAEGDGMVIESVASGVGGTVALNGDGSVSFTPDADFNGEARFTYRVKDSAGALSAAATATVIVTPVNDAPQFAAGIIGPAGVPAVRENTVVVATLSAIDVDGPVISFSVGGSDAAAFVIIDNVLKFVAPVDYEAPGDADGDNIYDVTLTASDGALMDVRSLEIAVSNADGNTIAGTSKNDWIDATHAVGGLTATDERDRIDGRSGRDNLAGGDGDDVLKGGSSDDRLWGEGGNDLLQGNAGRDRLDGGAGWDRADYSDMTKSVVVALAGSHTARVRIGGALDDTIKNIENVSGGRAADKLIGDSGANVLRGNGRGDVLSGGLGADTLAGGSSGDLFVFNARLRVSNVDVIVDFQHNADVIALENRIFKTIGASLNASEFYAAAGAVQAHDRTDRIIYDRATGELYYDEDGSRAGHAAIHFATLSNVPWIDAGDFRIV